ncbi:hypothetical protein WJ968_18140 [Achromobacter xylosoxidans]
MNTQKDPAKQVGIIADDLTSAADGAGPFMEWAGVAHISRGGLTRSDAPVLSVDTGSRALGEAEAGQVVGAPRGRWPIAAPCTRPWTRRCAAMCAKNCRPRSAPAAASCWWWRRPFPTRAG